MERCAKMGKKRTNRLEIATVLCEDNDVILKFIKHCDNPVIDEIWVQVDGEKCWIIIGFEDLKKAIKESEKLIK